MLPENQSSQGNAPISSTAAAAATARLSVLQRKTKMALSPSNATLSQRNSSVAYMLYCCRQSISALLLPFYFSTINYIPPPPPFPVRFLTPIYIYIYVCVSIYPFRFLPPLAILLFFVADFVLFSRPHVIRTKPHQHARASINPCDERELDLRGYKIPMIENLGVRERERRRVGGGGGGAKKKERE